MNNEYQGVQVADFVDATYHSKTELQEIEELYFQALEENGEDFIRYEDIGNGQFESHIADEYLVGVEEMIEYIKYNKGV